MNDKELADRIVALGVGVDWKDGTYGFGPNPSALDCVETFVRDWRVAGALMEKCLADRDTWRKLAGFFGSINMSMALFDLHRIAADFPRAICEACVEALND